MGITNPREHRWTPDHGGVEVLAEGVLGGDDRMRLSVVGEVLTADIEFPMFAQLLRDLRIQDDIERRAFEVLSVGHGRGIAVEVRHTAVAVELRGEVELPGTRRV